MKKWFNKIHIWALKWAETKWAGWAIFICAFADASFLPLPTLVFFLAVCLLNIKNTFKYVLHGSIGTLLGAVVGYSIGHYAWLNSNGEFTALANFIFNNIPGFTEILYNQIQSKFVEWDFWILLIAAFIPIPYKIFAISSGVFDINFLMFVVTTLISQSIKFYILAYLIVKIGLRVKKILDFNFKPIAIFASICLIILVIVKLL